MKKIWITGSRGRIGQALMSLLDVVEYEIFDTDKDEVDITDENQVYSFIKMNRPDVIINCSGFHEKTGSLKENVDHSYDVNAVGARNLAQAAEHINAKLIQLSTDDIFSEKSETPYNEFDFPKPEGIYAKSKYAGERLVRELMNRYVIIRSSWVYGIGTDFVDVVIEAANDENVDTLVLDDNAYAVPTSAEELAKIIKIFIDGEHYGIYHAVCSGGSCSRLEFANTVLEYTGLANKLKVVLKEGAKDKYSVLDNMMLRITGLPIPADWRVTLKKYIEETGENQ